MSAPQVIEGNLRKECQKIIEDCILFLLTEARDWRYPREKSWGIGQGYTLKTYVKRNTAYLFGKMQDSEYTDLFESVDDEDEQCDVDTMIMEVMVEMFPSIECLHADDVSNIECKFMPELRRVREMFRELD